MGQSQNHQISIVASHSCTFCNLLYTKMQQLACGNKNLSAANCICNNLQGLRPWYCCYENEPQQ